MAKRQPKVEAVSFHRNGSGNGVGFVVAIVKDPVHGRMLVTDFNYEDINPEIAGCTSVVRLDDAYRGNIQMHPLIDGHGKDIEGSGGNAYDGDRLGAEYRPLIRAAMDAQYNTQIERGKKRSARSNAAAKR